MNWAQLRKNLGMAFKLKADSSNATLPWSDWILRRVDKRGGYVLVDNLATGYLIPLTPRELVGFDNEIWGVPCLILRVGLYFDCPNAYFLYRNSRIERVTLPALL